MAVQIVFNHLPQVAAATKAGADDLSNELAKIAKNEAERLVPVRFGFLKAGIHLEGEGDTEVSVVASSVQGGANREYSQYVEYGTRFMAAQPFMTPAYVAALAALPAKSAAYGAKIEAAA